MNTRRADAPVGLADRARLIDLLPPEPDRYGHLRPRILSWRNARFRLVERCVPGLQCLDHHQRRRLSLSASRQASTGIHQHLVRGVRRRNPSTTTSSGNCSPPRSSTPTSCTCSSTCGFSGSLRARWSPSTAAATFSPSIWPAGIFSMLVWLFFAWMSQNPGHAIGASGGVTAVGMLFTLLLPETGDAARHHSDADVDADGSLLDLPISSRA